MNDLSPATSKDRTPSESNYAFRVQLAVRTTLLWLVLVAVAVLTKEFFLLMFSAILLAVFLSEGARLLESLLGTSRKWGLSIVVMLLLAILTFGLWVGGKILVEQSREAITAIRDNAVQWETQIAEIGLPVSLKDLAPSPGGQSLGFARAFFSSTLGFFTNSLFVAVVGVFLASSPETYRRGIANLWPAQEREGVVQLLRMSGATLKDWLFGQLFAMSIIGLVVGVSLGILGVPAAFALGLFAGAISFIPTIGATLAIIPALVMAAQQGSWTVIAVLVIYGVAQFFESNIATPLIQNRQVNLTAAAILGGQLFAGLLFGFLGVALITPFLAVAQLWLQRLYLPAREMDVPIRQYVRQALRNPTLLDKAT